MIVWSWGSSAERICGVNFLLGWHVCRAQLARNILLSYEVSYESAPTFFKPLFCGFKKSRRISAKFPAGFPRKQHAHKKVTDELRQARRDHFIISSGEFQENCPHICQRILPADFSNNFSALFLQGSGPPPKKNHAQNSCPKLSALLSNFKFLNLRTSSTTTRDRNLQFRGAVSTGGSPLDFLLFLQFLSAI